MHKFKIQMNFQTTIKESNQDSQSYKKSNYIDNKLVSLKNKMKKKLKARLKNTD